MVGGVGVLMIMVIEKILKKKIRRKWVSDVKNETKKWKE